MGGLSQDAGARAPRSRETRHRTFRLAAARLLVQLLDDARDRVAESFRDRFAGRAMPAERAQRAVDHVDVRQHRSEEHRPVLVQHQQRRQRFDVDLAQPVAVVLDVQPHVPRIHALLRAPLERPAVVAAGAAPVGAQAHHGPRGRAVGRQVLGHARIVRSPRDRLGGRAAQP
jgi:hypothetical protein